MSTQIMRPLEFVGFVIAIVTAMCVSLPVSAAEVTNSLITIEQVAAMDKLSPTEAGVLVEEWMGRRAFPGNFTWDAAMLFLRALPDHVSKQTLSNVLARITVDYDYRSGWQSMFSEEPIRTLLDINRIRLKHNNITNAIHDLMAVYETNKVGRLRCPDGFLQNEIVHTMLVNGFEVPESFRECPEYIRYNVVRDAQGMSRKDVLEKAFAMLWVPKRRLGDVSVSEGEDPAKAETRFRLTFYRKVFYSCAAQSMLLQETGTLADAAREFVDSHRHVDEGDEGARLAMQMIWAYIIIARGSPPDEATGHLRRVEDAVGEKRTKEILQTYGAAIGLSSDLWWYRKCAFASTKEVGAWGIVEHAACKWMLGGGSL
jgi:hypothetical protein